MLLLIPASVDPERFGTVVSDNDDATLVIPFNAKLALRAISLGAVEVEED